MRTNGVSQSPPTARAAQPAWAATPMDSSWVVPIRHEMPAAWAIWALTFALIRQVNPASAVACVLSAATVLVYPALLPGGERLGVLSPGGFTVLLMTVILLRLIEPVRSYLYAMKRQRSVS